MNRTPMKRTAFKRAGATTEKSEPNRAIALSERAQRAINSAAATAAMKSEQNQRLALNCKALAAIKYVAFENTMSTPIPKAEIVRSEPYRRVVATLPCVICGIHGYSQAAHGSMGKGMALKASDMELFPACGPRPGEVGCHSRLDQGALFTKEERRQNELRWAAETRETIINLGLWPKNLPLMESA